LTDSISLQGRARASLGLVLVEFISLSLWPGCLSLMIYLALVWVLGALGEELVYRCYLMNRAAGLFHSPKVAWTVSLVVVSVAFGCAHIDQGSTGTVRILRTDSYSVVVSGVRKKPCGAGDCTCILGYA